MTELDKVYGLLSNMADNTGGVHLTSHWQTLSQIIIMYVHNAAIYFRSRVLMVLEFMEGGELFDRISKESGFTEKKAAKFLKQVWDVQRLKVVKQASQRRKPQSSKAGAGHTDANDCKTSLFSVSFIAKFLKCFMNL